jgi:hypothetical protein
MGNKDLVATVALGLSIVTLVWRIRDERVSYLRIGLTVMTTVGGRFAIARATIRNDSIRIKKLSTAFLLVGPVEEDPIDTFNAAVGSRSGSPACCAIDFERLVPDASAADAEAVRRVVPLTYFTEENDNVGDEELAYSLPIDLASLSGPLTLSVRFYVYGCRRARQNYHRKVHDVLVVPEASSDEGVPSTRAPALEDVRGARPAPLPRVRDAGCRDLRGCPRRRRTERGPGV